jgi:hypothetical protein
MSINLTELKLWASEQPEKPFLIVVCDTFEYENYPVHCADAVELSKKAQEYDGKNMQRIEGMYIKDGLVPCVRSGRAVLGQSA